MSRTPKVLLGLAVVLSLTAFGFASPALADSEDSTITGHVFGADGITPLAGVRVQVMASTTSPWSGAPQAGQAVTGSDGSYTISNLPPLSGGTLEFLDPSADGYAEAFLGGALLFDDATKLSVGNLEMTVAPAMVMVHGGTIASDVTNPDGSTPEEFKLTIYAQKAAGAWTPIMRQDFSDGYSHSDLWPRVGDDVISPNLLPGSYRVCAGAESMAAQCTGDAASPGTSTPLTVTEGGAARADFAFYSGGTLSGTIAFPAGAPATATGTVAAWELNPDTNEWVPVVDALSTGTSWSLAHLRTGAYRLYVSTSVGDEWYSGAATVEDAQSVDVSATEPNAPMTIVMSPHHPIPTTTTVTSSKPTSALGATSSVSADILVSAQQGSAVPTGSVVLDVDGGVEVFTADLVDGSAKIQLPRDLGVGSHRLSAQYNPPSGTDFVESDSNQAAVAVMVSTPKDTMSGSATSKKLNGHRSASISTTVKQAAGAPIGRLKYYLGSKLVGTIVLTSTASAAARTTFVWKTASVGTHHFVVQFVPKGATKASVLRAITVKVKK